MRLIQRQPSPDFRKTIIACMPKSGSTYLWHTLGGLPGMRKERLVPGFRRREQEICIDRLRVAEATSRKALNRWRLGMGGKDPRPQGYVAQMHLRYSEPSGDLMKQYHIRPIVLVRNIFDIVMSVRDHYRNQAVFMSMAYVNDEMKEWPDERLHEFIADMVVPWYINFFMCWQECDEKLLISYEQVMADREGMLETIVDYLGLEVPEDGIEAAMQTSGKANTRKNAGVSGRGAALADDVVERIRFHASHYPDTDFSLIGL